MNIHVLITLFLLTSPFCKGMDLSFLSQTTDSFESEDFCELTFEEETKRIVCEFSQSLCWESSNTRQTLPSNIYQEIQLQFKRKETTPSETHTQVQNSKEERTVQEIISSFPKQRLTQEEIQLLSDISVSKQEIENTKKTNQTLNNKIASMQQDIATLQNKLKTLKENTQKKTATPQKQATKEQNNPIQSKKTPIQLIGDARRQLFKEYDVRTIDALKGKLYCTSGEGVYFVRQNIGRFCFFTYCAHCDDFKIYTNDTCIGQCCSK